MPPRNPNRSPGPVTLPPVVQQDQQQIYEAREKEVRQGLGVHYRNGEEMYDANRRKVYEFSPKYLDLLVQLFPELKTLKREDLMKWADQRIYYLMRGGAVQFSQAYGELKPESRKAVDQLMMRFAAEEEKQMALVLEALKAAQAGYKGVDEAETNRNMSILRMKMLRMFEQYMQGTYYLRATVVSEYKRSENEPGVADELRKNVNDLVSRFFDKRESLDVAKYLAPIFMGDSGVWVHPFERTLCGNFIEALKQDKYQKHDWGAYSASKDNALINEPDNQFKLGAGTQHTVDSIRAGFQKYAYDPKSPFKLLRVFSEIGSGLHIEDVDNPEASFVTWMLSLTGKGVDIKMMQLGITYLDAIRFLEVYTLALKSKYKGYELERILQPAYEAAIKAIVKASSTNARRNLDNFYGALNYAVSILRTVDITLENSNKINSTRLVDFVMAVATGDYAELSAKFGWTQQEVSDMNFLAARGVLRHINLQPSQKVPFEKALTAFLAEPTPENSAKLLKMNIESLDDNLLKSFLYLRAQMIEKDLKLVWETPAEKITVGREEMVVVQAGKRKREPVRNGDWVGPLEMTNNPGNAPLTIKAGDDKTRIEYVLSRIHKRLPLFAQLVIQMDVEGRHEESERRVILTVRNKINPKQIKSELFASLLSSNDLMNVDVVTKNWTWLLFRSFPTANVEHHLHPIRLSDVWGKDHTIYFPITVTMAVPAYAITNVKSGPFAGESRSKDFKINPTLIKEIVFAEATLDAGIGATANSRQLSGVVDEYLPDNTTDYLRLVDGVWGRRDIVQYSSTLRSTLNSLNAGALDFSPDLSGTDADRTRINEFLSGRAALCDANLITALRKTEFGRQVFKEGVDSFKIKSTDVYNLMSFQLVKRGGAYVGLVGGVRVRRYLIDDKPIYTENLGAFGLSGGIEFKSGRQVWSEAVWTIDNSSKEALEALSKESSPFVPTRVTLGYQKPLPPVNTIGNAVNDALDNIKTLPRNALLVLESMTPDSVMSFEGGTVSVAVVTKKWLEADVTPLFYWKWTPAGWINPAISLIDSMLGSGKIPKIKHATVSLVTMTQQERDQLGELKNLLSLMNPMQMINPDPETRRKLTLTLSPFLVEGLVLQAGIIEQQGRIDKYIGFDYGTKNWSFGAGMEIPSIGGMEAVRVQAQVRIKVGKAATESPEERAARLVRRELDVQKRLRERRIAETPAGKRGTPEFAESIGLIDQVKMSVDMALNDNVVGGVSLSPPYSSMGEAEAFVRMLTQDPRFEGHKRGEFALDLREEGEGHYVLYITPSALKGVKPPAEAPIEAAPAEGGKVKKKGKKR